MPGPDKAGMLARIAGKARSGYGSDDVIGAAPETEPDGDEAATPASEGTEALTCGEQLKSAIDSGDTSAIDDALREAVRKYSRES